MGRAAFFTKFGIQSPILLLEEGQEIFGSRSVQSWQAVQICWGILQNGGLEGSGNSQGPSGRKRAVKVFDFNVNIRDKGSWKVQDAFSQRCRCGAASTMDALQDSGCSGEKARAEMGLLPAFAPISL